MSAQKNISDCPEAGVLVAYLDGHGNEQLDLHIAACSSCVDKLDKLHDDQFHNAATPVHDAKEFLNEPEFDQFQQKIQNLFSTAPPPEPTPMPDRINRFEVRRWLGSGTFGDVYAAFDPLLKIDVAIKVSRSGLFSSKSSQADFLREAQHVARLNHPGLVHIRDVIIDGDRTAIVMNLVDGGTLKDRLKSAEVSPLALADAVGMMIQIARAAHFAHEAGLIHRDLKPANILLEADGRPVIADFGLAFDHREQSSDSLHRAGTLSYMPPEQYKSEEIDRRCDLWAMGVILAEMIHGERPFPQKTRAELERAICEEPPQLPDDPTKRHLNTIIKKCLAKSPADRYATADQFAHDLEQWHRECTATGISRWKYGWRRNVALTVSTLLLLGTIFLAQQQSNKTRLTQTAANLEAATASQIPRLVHELAMLRATPDFLKGRSVSSNDAGRFRLNLARAACRDNDPQLSTDIVNYLRTAKLEELKAALTPGVCDSIRDGLLTSTRGYFEDQLTDSENLRLAAIAARFGPDDTIWPGLRDRVANELCSVPEHELADWLLLFHPVGARFLGEPLQATMTLPDTPKPIRHRSSVLLASFFKDEMEQLTELIKVASVGNLGPFIEQLHRQPKPISDEAKRSLFDAFQTLTRGPRNPTPDDDEPPTDQDLQASRVAVALWKFGDATAACLALRDDPNPTLQRLVIYGLHEQSASPSSLIEKIREHRANQSSESRAIVFGLLQTLWLTETSLWNRQPNYDWLTELYRHSPDSGIHSMSGLLLRRLGLPCDIGPGDHGEWRVEQISDFTMEFRVIERDAFLAGTPKFETMPLGVDSWPRHQRRIKRRFAIGLSEITWQQIRWVKPKAGFHDGVEMISSLDAAATYLNEDYLQDIYTFCNRCSTQNGLEPCFELVNGKLKPYANFLDRTGYRLPTDGEWECACRAGTTTERFFGQIPRDKAFATLLVNQYGWHMENAVPLRAAFVSQPVRTRLPNRWGLFDTYGNARELCMIGTPPSTEASITDDDVDATLSPSGTCMRGPSVGESGVDYARSHARSWRINEASLTGIRIVKTIQPR